jgi:hypothetical protein
MKKSILFALCSILIFAFSVSAQDVGGDRYSSARLENLVTQLKAQTVDLVDSTSENLTGRAVIPRADIEAAFLAQQLDASVGFLQQLLRDGIRSNNLRDAVSIISDLARRTQGYNSSSNAWLNVQNTISDINRELGGNNGGEINPPTANGRVFWVGKVDIETHLIIKGKNLETRVVAGPNHGGEKFSFTSPLPTRNVKIEVLKKRGRGVVKVLEQPSRDNDYTAIVQIRDDGSGWKEYELEISWK